LLVLHLLSPNNHNAAGTRKRTASYSRKNAHVNWHSMESMQRISNRVGGGASARADKSAEGAFYISRQGWSGPRCSTTFTLANQSAGAPEHPTHRVSGFPEL